jgi:chemotaxis protein CheD
MVAADISRSACFLMPKDYIVTGKPMIVSTVLGSCVAVCLFSSMPRVAAMCHCVLPWRGPAAAAEPVGYFVDETVQHLVAMTRKRGAAPGATRAVLVGGAGMHAGTWIGPKGDSVGALNIRTARETLAAAGIPLVAEHVGGPAGRKVRFDTLTFDITLRLVSAAEDIVLQTARPRHSA